MRTFWWKRGIIYCKRETRPTNPETAAELKPASKEMRMQEAPQDQQANGYTEITAKFAGTCRNCESPYSAGEQVLWKPGHAVHAQCAGTMPTGSMPAKEKRPLPAIPDRTYTVVLNESGDYRTVKFETVKKGPLEGRRVVSFLSGPDNETSFTGFGFVTPDNHIKVWSKYEGHGALPFVQAAVRILYKSFATDSEAKDKASEAYAMVSGRCSCCGRKLTVPASLHRGLGPVCAKKGH